MIGRLARFLVQTTFLASSLVLGFGLSAQDVATPDNSKIIPVMLVTSSITTAQGTYTSEKADVDALFMEHLSAFEQDLLSRLNLDGRYQVSSLSVPIPAHQLNRFVAQLASRKKTGVGLTPDPLSSQDSGEITTEDWDRLLKMRYLLIPQVESWDMVYDPDPDNPGYKASVLFRLSQVDVAKAQVLSTIGVLGTGLDAAQASVAVSNACQNAGLVALNQLQAVASMRLTTRIGELVGADVILDFGANIGVLPGDRFEVLGESDDEDSLVTGELVVRDVRPQLCFAQVVWTRQALKVGDRIRELPRELIHGSIMGSAMVHLITDEINLSGVGASLRLAFNQGLFWYRPLFDLGFVVMPGTSFFDNGYGLPVSIMGGAEVLWRLGIFTISPNFLVGGVFLIPLEADKDWQLGGLRGQIGLRFDLQIGPLVDIFVEPGYGIVFSGGTFSGLVINAGVTLR